MKFSMKAICGILALLTVLSLSPLVANAQESEIQVQPLLHEIPQYFQTDYPEVRYGAGSIATSGCSVINLALYTSCCSGERGA